MQDKSKPPASRKEAPPAPAAPGRRLERRLRVRFYCSMRQQRVYPLTVEIQPAGGGPAPAAAGVPVTVRPVIPGAQVTPAEQRLDATQPNVRATFQVTPLARGRLRDARAEVHQQGQQIDQVRLRMKSTTGRLTRALAALTVLVPLLLVLFTSERYYKLRGQVPDLRTGAVKERYIRRAAAAGADQKANQPPEKGKPDQGEAAADPKPPDLKVAVEPGDLMEDRVLDLADAFVPKFPNSRKYVVEPVARGLGWAYSWACSLAPDYLPFWVLVGLLCLTLLSWVASRPQRSSRRKALSRLVVPPAQTDAETLPLSPREQAPLTVQPVE